MFRRHAVLLLVLALSACSASATSDSQSGPPAPSGGVAPSPSAVVTSEPPPTIILPGPCEHLLWPLVNGTSWRYQLTRAADGSTQTLSLDATVSDESAGLTLKEGNGPVESQITCAPDGFYGPPGGLVVHPDLGEGLTLTSPDRPFLPSADQLLPLGTSVSWDVQYDAGGTLLLPLSDGVIQASVTGGEVVLYATANSLETVTVPAGTFNALAVEQSTFFNLQLMTEGGSTGNLFGDAVSRLYYSEGVGLVRQMFEGGTLSGTVGSSPFAIELQGDISLDLLEYREPIP